MLKKTMTLLTLAAALTVAPATLQLAQANDGAYYMSGNQLVPMHTTQIDVKKEVLDIRREGEDIVVDVHYELYNKGEPVSLLVGFEAMPPAGDASGLPKNGEHPYMKNFTAKVNGEPVSYAVALVPTAGHWQKSGLNLDQAASPFYFQEGRINQEYESSLRARTDNDDYEVGELYVYHFSADFKSGTNTIDHRYRFEASSSIGHELNFDYVLKAINRWGDSTIDDFQLTLDMGDRIEYIMPNTFFDSSREWQVKGIGKIYPTPTQQQSRSLHPEKDTTTFAIRSGKVVFNKKSFTPKDDLYLDTTSNLPNGDTFNAYKDNLPMVYQWVVPNDKNLNTFSRQVLRNFPFAIRGYVFSNAKLQAYYERQPWYIPDPSYQANYTKLSKAEKAYFNKLK